ncbi:sensor histidine kinase [Dyella kyungheensis]|jgi:two-component system sensor histidine kinase DesK|uniref:Sensor histidine kinase n=1 Tax=Dyella kyungheensis TaxID=1242174 RepID=A0ABS2JNQ9_9GAMM|nr:sensor histidine kinase [Dyella kyungheensis]
MDTRRIDHGERGTVRQWLKNWFTPAPDSLVAISLQKGKSPWVDAIHLLWSVWVFVIPAFDHYTWSWAFFTLLTYPLFLLLYAKCCLASRRQARYFALTLVAMSMLLLPWYSAALTYFVYGTIMLRSCRMALRNYMGMLVMLNVILIAEVSLLHYAWQAVIWIPVTSIIVGLVVHAERLSEEKEAELRLSHDEVRRLAALAERERIGRDLHDLLGHTLSLITLKLELSRKLFDRDSEAAKREMAEAERVARHALSEVRTAVSGIRATDLAAELAAARLMLEASMVSLECTPLPPSLPIEVERGLALVLREAVTNIARHARANRARVSTAVAGQALKLSIEDDGRGGVGIHGNGLKGMHERVRALGGTLEVISPVGKGTRLHITVPLRSRPPQRELAQDEETPNPAAAG